MEVELLDRVVFDNTLLSWLGALLVLIGVPVVGWWVLGFARIRIRRLAETTETRIYDVADAFVSATKSWLLGILGVWGAIEVLETPEPISDLASGLIAVGVFVQAGLWATALLGFGLEQYRTNHADNAETATAMGALDFLGRFVIWTATFMLVLDNLGFDVTALITGLGVGGIAVALAVQNVLGDLFASVSIVFDKPFVVGDSISVGDFVGTVESVGLKTTRLRSVSGEQIVMANSDLLQSRIRNFKRATQRRNSFRLGVTYDTRPEQLRRVSQIAREAIEAEGEQVKFERAHFVGFGDASLDFETVWWTLDPDYALFMDQQERIYLRLLEALTAEGIHLAFPTRTVRVVSEGDLAPEDEIRAASTA